MFPRQAIQHHGNPSQCPDAKEAEVDHFYENLEDFLELTPKKDILFIFGYWNAKVGSQDISGITGKFGFGEQNEKGQRVTGFCQENALVIANTLFQQHETTVHMDICKRSILKSN